MNSPPPTTENSTTPAAANSPENYTPTPAIGNSPSPAIANLPTSTTENSTTPVAANSPANYTPTPAIGNSPPLAIANLPTSATENSTNPAIYCLCQQRCATKRCPCKRNRIPCGFNCHPRRSCANIGRINTGNPLFIDLTCNDVDGGAQLAECWVTVGDVRMTTGDKTDLSSRSHTWLNDRHMTAAQIILKCAHSNVVGLQAPTLQCTRTFEVHQEKQFVQILNLSKSHWIAISTLNCQLGTVHVYDSMQLGLSSSLKRIVADLMFYKGKKITIKYMHIQQQKGASDCGLFAIATATAL